MQWTTIRKWHTANPERCYTGYKCDRKV